MVIPCKECIVLAICVNKESVIRCNKLYEWYWGCEEDENFDKYSKEIENVLRNKKKISTIILKETNSWPKM